MKLWVGAWRNGIEWGFHPIAKPGDSRQSGSALIALVRTQSLDGPV
jgi:hypothetical protein